MWLGRSLSEHPAWWRLLHNTALIGSLDAPLAPLWVWLAFNETPSASTFVGGLIVFVAVAIHVVVEARKRQGLIRSESDELGETPQLP